MSARPMRLEIKRTSITRRCDCESCRLVVLPARDRIVVGAWYWRTKASNGPILCHSEAYQRLRGCAHGAGLVTSLELYGVKPGDDFTLPTGQTRSHDWRIVVDK